MANEDSIERAPVSEDGSGTLTAPKIDLADDATNAVDGPAFAEPQSSEPPRHSERAEDNVDKISEEKAATHAAQDSAEGSADGGDAAAATGLPLRRSCVGCTQARKKCQIDETEDVPLELRVCQRCQRLGIECEFIKPQKRGPKGPRKFALGLPITETELLTKRRRTPVKHLNMASPAENERRYSTGSSVSDVARGVGGKRSWREADSSPRRHVQQTSQHIAGGQQRAMPQQYQQQPPAMPAHYPPHQPYPGSAWQNQPQPASYGQQPPLLQQPPLWERDSRSEVPWTYTRTSSAPNTGFDIPRPLPGFPPPPPGLADRRLSGPGPLPPLGSLPLPSYPSWPAGAAPQAPSSGPGQPPFPPPPPASASPWSSYPTGYEYASPGYHPRTPSIPGGSAGSDYFGTASAASAAPDLRGRPDYPPAPSGGYSYPPGSYQQQGGYPAQQQQPGVPLGGYDRGPQAHQQQQQQQAKVANAAPAYDRAAPRPW